MTEPFTTPPPLGGDIEARAHQFAQRLRARRRAGIVGAAALVLLLLGGAAAAAAGGNHRDAKVHVAGSPEASSSSSGSSLPDETVTSRLGALLSSTSAPHPSTPGEMTPTTSGAGSVEPGSGPGGTSAPGTDQTTPPGSITTTSQGWNPLDVCAPGPQGTTITLTPTIQAQQVAPGKWHLSGTMTIVNSSAYEYYTTGFLYITGTTVPGGTGEGWVGWTGTETVMIGSGFSVGGMVRVPPGQTVTVPLEQTKHTDGDANAYATGTTAPTTIHQGKDFGTFDRFVVDQCSNVPTVVDNFPIGGNPPS